MIQSFGFLVASHIPIVVLHEFSMLLHYSQGTSSNPCLILTSPKTPILRSHPKHRLKSIVLDDMRPMQHVAGDVHGEESEIV